MLYTSSFKWEIWYVVHTVNKKLNDKNSGNEEEYERKKERQKRAEAAAATTTQ